MKLNTSIPHERFCGLASKYSVSVPKSWHLERGATGWRLRDETRKAGFIPLFPWRNERRFIELLRIVETQTLEDVALCRFSCVTDGETMNLRQILYREFDLLQWILGTPIVSVFSSSHADKFANVLLRLENDVIGSVEAGATLPAGRSPLDRHELIARRGVASDRVVDTHVPQESVYLFGERGVRCWTDTDAELFGLDIDEINAVRAAFELARHPGDADSYTAQHEWLLGLVGRVF